MLSLKQLKNNLGIWILIICQILASVIMLSMLYGDIAILVESARRYEELGLKDFLMVSIQKAADKDRILEEVRQQYPDMIFVSTKAQIGFFSTDPTAYLYYLERDFIENVKYTDIEGEWFDPDKDYGGYIPMVVPKYWSQKYKLGGIYEIDNGYEKKETVKVIGVLHNDTVFLPQGRGALMEDLKSGVLVYGMEQITYTVPEIEQEMRTVITFRISKDSSVKLTEAEENLENIAGVEDVYTAESEYRDFMRIRRQNAGLPSVLCIALLSLSIIGFISYNILSIRQKEKFFALCFLHGLSPVKCIFMQLANDLATFLIPLIISFITIGILDYGKAYGERLFSSGAAAWVFILYGCMFVITSVVSVVKLSKEEPIQIIRRNL